MIKKTTLTMALAGLALLGLTPAAHAGQPDYAQDVQFGVQASPVDLGSKANATGSSVGQYGKEQTNSQIDNYIYQDDQLNLNENSGVVRVLRTNQKEQINDFVTAFVPLNHVTVRELRGLARTLCRKEGGEADVLNDKVRGRNGIVVVCPQAMVPSITRTLQALDHDWVKEVNDGSWNIYYQGKNRDVNEIFKTIKYYRSPDATYEFDPMNNAIAIYDQPCVEPLVRRGLREIDIPPSQILLDVAIYEINTQNDLAVGLDFESWKNGPGRDLFQFAAWNFGGDKNGFPGNLPANAADWGSFRSYNFMLTTAYIDFLQSKGKARLVTKSTLAAKSGSIGTLSAVDQIVALQSATDTNNSDLGLVAPYRLSDVYEYYHKKGLVSPSLENLAELKGDQAIATVNGFLSNVLKLDDKTVAVVIAQLNEKNKDGKISREELEETRLPLAAMLNVFRDRTLNYVQSGQTGVLLSVAPVVGLESAEVALSLDVSDVTDYTPSGTPVIEHRSISSEVELKDGQPFVLGGLKRNETVKTGSGVPFLRDIPVAGYLFGREVTTKRQKELVVLVTPRFKLCTMAEPNPPKELQTVLNLAKAENKGKLLEVPKDAFGFDQWLGLDELADKRMNEVNK